MPTRTLLSMGDGEARSSESAEQDWADLARNPPGIGITHEAARRRQAEGLGADRSWRVGAEGEFAVADLLATLTEPSRWQRWCGRSTGWFVLHSVPLGDGHGRVRGDVDHLVIGPPGLVSINTKHHRTGKLYLDGDELIQRVTGSLQQTLTAKLPKLTGKVPVRPLLVIVGGRLMTDAWPAGVTVVMASKLIEALRAFPAVLSTEEVGAVYELARRSTTWNPAVPPPSAGVQQQPKEGRGSAT